MLVPLSGWTLSPHRSIADILLNLGPIQQPKKLVRYLDNKVVSVKGERYTEIKEDADGKDDVKKTYVSLKPARQYRFH